MHCIRLAYIHGTIVGVVEFTVEIATVSSTFFLAIFEAAERLTTLAVGETGEGSSRTVQHNTGSRPSGTHTSTDRSVRATVGRGGRHEGGHGHQHTHSAQVVGHVFQHEFGEAVRLHSKSADRSSVRLC